MSTGVRREYRFATAAQWSLVLRHRFDIDPQGGLRAIPRVAPLAKEVMADASATAIAVASESVVCWRSAQGANVPGAALNILEPDDTARRRYEVSGVLATSTRWLADAGSLWALTASTVTRTRLEALYPDLRIDVPQAVAGMIGRKAQTLSVVDIAIGRCHSVWTLVHSKAAEGQNAGDFAAHFDGDGKCDAVFPIPTDVSVCACEDGQVSAGAALQIGALRNGAVLAVLAGEGRLLLLLDAQSGSTLRTVALSTLASHWAARRMATDGRERMALLGRVKRGDDAGPPELYVLDGTGEPLDGPLNPLPSNTTVRDLAIHRSGTWFATDRGIWRLDSAAGAGGGASQGLAESYVLLPLLLSPESDRGRGWLRAELCVELPEGAAIEAEFSGTDDDRIADRVRAAANASTGTVAARIQAAWSSFDAPPKSMRFSGTELRGVPLAIPLFGVAGRWMLLGIRLIVPPGVQSPSIRELRVIYPDDSLQQHIPAIFRGETNDPNAFLRRVLGVLETTTQSLDRRIAAIGATIDASNAPEPLLDYIAGWLGVPWDQSLTLDARRRIVANNADLNAKRGTRAGLVTFLRALIGERGQISISDLTGENEVARLGGGGCSGTPLPALLAGMRLGTATLGGKAVLGRARLPCTEDLDSALDPLAVLQPEVRIELSVDVETRRSLEKLLPRLLREYLPAGVRARVRWRTRSAVAGADEFTWLLDGEGPGVLGKDSRVGRTVLAGMRVARLREPGVGMGFTLQ